MAPNGIHDESRGGQTVDATAAELIDGLSQFDGPPEQFLSRLLALQCRLAPASGGAIVRTTDGQAPEILAVHPPLDPSGHPPRWLADAIGAAGAVIDSGEPDVRPFHQDDALYGQTAQRHIILVPLRSGQTIRGAAAYLVDSGDPKILAAEQQRLELTASLLNLYETRLTLQQRQGDLRRLRTAMELLSSVNESDRFARAAMAFCNELATRWQCDSVGLGFLKGRYVHLKALSHTEKFSRKMKRIQDIESAMEECLDQDVEIAHPADREATYISRSAVELSNRHGPTAVLSLPLRRDDRPMAVVTAERPIDAPFTLDEAESLRVVSDLCTARLSNLYEHDRWFGARAAGALRKGLAFVLGAKHTWIKLVILAVLGGVLFLTFAKGDYRAGGTFVLETTQQQIVSAPFDGFLGKVLVHPDSRVVAGKTVLAELLKKELLAQLARAEADLTTAQTQKAAAMMERKEAEKQIAESAAKKAVAEINLLKYRIASATIISPITGRVLEGDLQRQIGAPVKTGDVLFKIAPLDKLRAEVLIPEDEIADVQQAYREGKELRGQLAAVGKAGVRIGFVVERITPVAEVVEQENVFRVRVRLLETRPWMKPGLEGVAKIHLGRRRYLWLWTRRLVNWIRMKLWI